MSNRKGIFNFISANLAMTRSIVSGVTLIVHELVGGIYKFRPNGLTRHFPEFRHEKIVRKLINCGKDGVWVIKEFDAGFRSNEGRTIRDVRISAAMVKHVAGVATFGYVIEESPPLLKLLPERAKELGLTSSIKYELLKRGRQVTNDDGTREILPEEATIPSKLKARKFAYVGDNHSVLPPMAKLCEHADLLVHESSKLSESDQAVSICS